MSNQFRSSGAKFIALLLASFAICVNLVPALALTTSSAQLVTFGEGTVGYPDATNSFGTYIWPTRSTWSTSYMYLWSMSSDGTVARFGNQTLYVSSGSLNASDLVVAADDTLYMTGQVYSGNFPGLTSLQSQGVYLAKFNSQGSLAWVKSTTLGGSDPVVSVGPNGEALVAFTTGSGSTIKMFKYDGDGLLLWSKTLQSNTGSYGENHGRPVAVAINSVGKSFVTYAGGSSGEGQIVVRTFNSLGESINIDSTSASAMPLRFYSAARAGMTLPQFAAGISTSPGNETLGGGFLSYRIDADGNIINEIRREDYTFVLDGIDVISETQAYASGSTNLLSSPIYNNHPRVMLLSQIDVEWDAYYRGYFGQDLTLNLTGARSVTGNSADGLYFNSGDLTGRGIWFRSVYTYPTIPRLSEVGADVTGDTATISATLNSGNLNTSLKCLVSTSADFSSAFETLITNSTVIGGNFSCLPSGTLLGHSYFFKVEATNSLGTVQSSTGTFYIPDLPSTPVVSANLDGRTSRLLFPEPSSNGSAIQSYVLEKRIGNGSWTVVEPTVTTIDHSITLSETNSQGDAGKSLAYRVRAVNGVGNSAYSNEVTLVLPQVPTAPVSLIATATTSDITISWQDPPNIGSAGPLTYLLQTTTNGLTWTDFTPSTFPNSRSAVFDSAVNGLNYRFKIKALNAFGESLWSSSSNQVTLASQYTVTFNYNLATGGNSVADAIFTTGGTAITLPTPTRTGYTFAGWFEDSGFSGLKLGSTYAPTQSRTIYAKWTVNETPSPTPSPATYSVSAKKKYAVKSLAKQVGVRIVSSKAKVTFKVSGASKKVCTKSGTKLKTLKAGNCIVTFTVQEPKPKKGKKPKATKTVKTLVVQ